jgi:hypothetical protein
MAAECCSFAVRKVFLGTEELTCDLTQQTHPYMHHRHSFLEAYNQKQFQEVYKIMTSLSCFD